jgi:hypothetical protein
MTISLIKGEDRLLVTRIVFENTNEPYDLSGWTRISAHFKKSDGTVLEKHSDLQGGSYASAYYEGIVFTAEEIGDSGNNIILVFDGIKTVSQVLTDWNENNPNNQVVSDSIDESVVLTASNVQLEGGVLQYRDVVPVSDVLGKVQINLNEEDTGSLKIGKNLSFKLIVDKGETRRIVMFHSSINVYDSDVVGY